MSGTRRRRAPEDARENILAAAEALLTAEGPQELKLARVAAEAGVATATVMHHFGSVDGVQTALMERMITRLADRVIAITEEAPAQEALGMAADLALFDAFEEKGAARLAAWLVMTGEARRLSVVRRAVTETIDRTLARFPRELDRDVLEEMTLLGITAALGSGLFGATLSELLGKPADAARQATLAALAARLVQVESKD